MKNLTWHDSLRKSKLHIVIHIKNKSFLEPFLIQKNFSGQ